MFMRIDDKEAGKTKIDILDKHPEIDSGQQCCQEKCETNCNEYFEHSKEVGPDTQMIDGASKNNCKGKI